MEVLITVAIIFFFLLALAFGWLALRFREISPQMTTLQTELENTRGELTLTRAQNKCLQEALAKTITSQEELQKVLQACTLAHEQ